MKIGIIVENCGNCVIQNGVVIGSELGMSVENSDIKLDRIAFENVSTAVRGTGDTPIDANNVTHTEMDWAKDPTPLEMVKGIANVNV